MYYGRIEIYKKIFLNEIGWIFRINDKLGVLIILGDLENVI